MAGDKKNPPVNWRGSVGVDLSLSGEDAFRIYVGVLFTYSGLGQGADETTGCRASKRAGSRRHEPPGRNNGSHGAA